VDTRHCPDSPAVVCATDSDLTLQSFDGVLYKVHRTNLEVHSESFAAANSISATSDSSEVVYLDESSAVLDLLLQFMYRQRQPDLEEVDFQTLSELAEAAEKYEVYSAMTVCSIHMGYVQMFSASMRSNVSTNFIGMLSRAMLQKFSATRSNMIIQKS
jgi:hypothetical protein